MPPQSFPLVWGPLPTEQNPGQFDWVANSFVRDDADHIALVPLSKTELWETIEMHSKRLAPRMLLGIFPNFLQLDMRFYRALRTLSMTALSFPEEQLRAALSLIEPMHVDGIVLTQPALLACLEEVNKSVSSSKKLYYQVVLGPHEQPAAAFAAQNIFFEVHVVPGVVCLYQCEHLAGSAALHPSNRFGWEYENSYALVSDPAQKRFTQARLPNKLQVEERACPCGMQRQITFV